MESYLGVARKQGITDEEIGAAQAIVMAVQAGRVRAQFREVREGQCGGAVAETAETDE
jgi:hypothetical protein